MQRFLAPTIAALTVLLASTMGGTPLGAQSMHLGPNDPYCGAWSGATWSPNGNCVLDTTTTPTTVAIAGSNPVYQRIRGHITAWNGNQITLQRGHSALVVNDQPAIDHNATGPIHINRRVIAHGYWQNGSFFVNRFESQ